MNTAVAAAAIAASPFQADPVGTKRPLLDFLDEARTRVIDPYVSKVRSPLLELMGIQFMGARETAAVEALGYEPADVVHLFSSFIGSNIETDEDGLVRVVDEMHGEKTPEMWAVVLGVDGNEPDENGVLPDEAVTLVRII